MWMRARKQRFLLIETVGSLFGSHDTELVRLVDKVLGVILGGDTLDFRRLPVN
jgi:hypothetical protein